MSIFGKLLQFLGLMVTGAALVVGVTSGSPRLELGYLAAGAILFLLGVLVLRFASGGSSQ